MTAPTTRPYRPPVPVFWWLRRRSYVVFVLRELTSVFVAWFVVFLLLLGQAVPGGEAAYHRFLELAATPKMLVLNLMALLFVVFHAVTWFSLAPRAMVVRVRGRRVPPGWVAAGHYAAWLVVSVLVAWLVLG